MLFFGGFAICGLVKGEGKLEAYMARGDDFLFFPFFSFFFFFFWILSFLLSYSLPLLLLVIMVFVPVDYFF